MQEVAEVGCDDLCGASMRSRRGGISNDKNDPSVLQSIENKASYCSSLLSQTIMKDWYGHGHRARLLFYFARRTAHRFMEESSLALSPKGRG